MDYKAFRASLDRARVTVGVRCARQTLGVEKSVAKIQNWLIFEKTLGKSYILTIVRPMSKAQVVDIDEDRPPKVQRGSQAGDLDRVGKYREGKSKRPTGVGRPWESQYVTIGVIR